MTAVAQPDIARRVVAVSPSNQFYTRMAYACGAVAILGFAPTYWIPLITGTLTVSSPIVHVHAVVFYGWLALLVIQTRFAATRRLTRHREFGVLGVSVATAMCFVGIAAAVNSIKVASAAGFGDAARAFAVVPVSGIAFFAVAFTAALLNVKRLDVHKRLILVATISLLQAAVGRWFLLVLAPNVDRATGPPPVFVSILPGLVSDLLLVAAMIYDRRTLGHVHRVYWIWGAALVALQVLRVPISQTTTWTAIARYLERF